MDILEKTAYLRGLCDGLEIKDDTKEGKLLLAIVDVLDSIAASVSDLEAVTDEMSDELDEVAEELLELEGAFDDCNCGCDCGDDCDCHCHDDDDDCDCDCEDFHFEVVCPTCGDSIMVDEDIINLGSINCPNCNEELEFDLDGIEDCDCEDCED
ncbi:MAG: hypothetical protein E7473_09875 [Ruminococcaceae bacterium]|nr:hypothetical protein [Oscillospiraceae bacterium]